MWNRMELKMRGKECFRKNYGQTVLVSLIFILISSNLTAQVNNSRRLENSAGGYLEGFPATVWIAGIIFGIAVMALGILVFNVLKVGAQRFFIENRDYNASVSKVLFGFQSGHYGNVVLVMFMQDLFLFLWTLLFVIPGIIKGYSYRMVPYIVAEQPDIDYREAIRISREMMNGEKLNAFVLDLSFFPWLLLTGITCGLAGIFYVNPYIFSTDAELYVVLRDKWLLEHRNGTVEY
ncbi:MAG: DUF975 family protein [Blautia sp.]